VACQTTRLALRYRLAKSIGWPRVEAYPRIRLTSPFGLPNLWAGLRFRLAKDMG